MKTIQKIALTLLFLACLQLGLTQNGEQLFKAKCNTCHLVDKNSTGPVLKGVKQKWNDAGEAEMLYDWVKNPPGLIASGKSKMAAEIRGFSQTDMTPQQVTNEEIDAILTYVDEYAPPPPPPPTNASATDPLVKVVPDYKANLKLFYWLLAGTLLLLIAILVVSTSIITLVKSDYFQQKLRNKNNQLLKTVLVLIGFGFIASQNTSLALKYIEPGASTEPSPWLLVEQTDIYLLLCIDIILLAVLIYLKRMFKNFMELIQDKQVNLKPEATPLRKINQVLTDAVPIEEESKIMLHHEYDGIRELDNNLPPWWVWGFVATIVFAIVYLVNYHVIKVSDLQLAAYEKDMKKSELEVQEYRNKMAMNVDENTATLMLEASDLSAGKSIFQANCVTCHNPGGEGNIGPNLTDKSWIYGYDIKEVFKTIKIGTPNGMPEHNSKLNPIQIQQVSSYLLGLPEKSGKEEQGTIIEK